jgi:hypothetical protein
LYYLKILILGASVNQDRPDAPQIAAACEEIISIHITLQEMNAV